MADYVIGVDLGGTKVLTGLADSSGEILARKRLEVGEDKGKEAVVERITESIFKVVEEEGVSLSEVAGIGLGMPGPLSVEKGLVFETPNLDLENVKIVAALEEELERPVFLENDANAAALGEKYFGAGQGVEDLIYVTVSTGIGGGVIIDGQVYHGVSDGAGEVGHMTLEPSSEVKCGCGNYGCWEALASGTALERRAQEAVAKEDDTLLAEMVDSPEDLDGAVVAKAARQGDQLAREVFSQVANYIGIGFANLINIFNPAKIVIGGGVSNSWDLIEDEVKDVIKERAFDSLVAEVELTTSDLGDEVGLGGAVAVALERLK